MSSASTTTIQPVIGHQLRRAGLDGSGVTVAVIDSGIDPGAYTGDLVAGPDFTVSAPRRDHTGHGTHLGAIVGDAEVGIAPGARLIDIRVAGDAGQTDVGAVIAALDWVVAHRFTHGIRVVLLAFGADRIAGAGPDPLAVAAERAWAAGVVVVVSAGNAGADAAMQTPATATDVLTVGAAEVVDGVWAPCAFSSRQGGTVDLYAPGRSIVSALAAGSTGAAAPESAKVGDRHVKGSGSSQAAAVVAGAVALLVQADPSLTPDAVRSILAVSAQSRRAGFAGVLDLDIAIASLRFDATPVVDARVLVSAGQSWGGLEWGGHSWGGHSWGGHSWGGHSWGGHSWGGHSWGGQSWGGHSWGGHSWGGHSWGGHSWGGLEWA